MAGGSEEDNEKREREHECANNMHGSMGAACRVSADSIRNPARFPASCTAKNSHPPLGCAQAPS
eukprot:scaffold64981_cov66-Phaeocystis_antarctica.AAC.1